MPRWIDYSAKGERVLDVIPWCPIIFDIVPRLLATGVESVALHMEFTLKPGPVQIMSYAAAQILCPMLKVVLSHQLLIQGTLGLCAHLLVTWELHCLEAHTIQCKLKS